MALRNRAELSRKLKALRRALEPAFAPDTARGGHTDFRVRSSGHCGAVAAIVQAELGGDLVSALVDGHSHWFNRVTLGSELFDVDITGDQFGRPTLQIAHSSRLYDDSRVRLASDLDAETRFRAQRLCERSGLRSLDVHTSAEATARS